MEEYPGEWWTAPTESIDNPARTVFVTGRLDVEKFRDNPKYCNRLEVTFKYAESPAGMPDRETAELLKSITDNLVSTFNKNKVAILTGIYTGDGERNWVFYTKSLPLFGNYFNKALATLPLLPLEITAESDPAWVEYTQMSEILKY